MKKIKKIISALSIVAGAFCMISCKSNMVAGMQEAESLENTKKIFRMVNKNMNGMFISSTNENNPVLLFISGGPGVPEVWLNEAYAKEYPNEISKYFTVCWWDYLGEGLSYDSKIKPEEITLERLAQDAHEVAQYLKTTYNQQKIYLMAHSSGTNLGLYLAQTNQEDFYCYFAMGQDFHDQNHRYE